MPFKNPNKDDSTTSDKITIQNSVIDSDEEDNSFSKAKSTLPKIINKSPSSVRIQKSIIDDEGKSQKSHIAEESFIGYRKVRAVIESDSDDDRVVENLPTGKPDDNVVTKENSVLSNLSSFSSGDEHELSNGEQQSDKANDVLNISAKLNNTKLDTGK